MVFVGPKMAKCTYTRRKIIEPRNPAIGEFYTVKNRQSTDFDAKNWQMFGQVGINAEHFHLL